MTRGTAAAALALLLAACTATESGVDPAPVEPVESTPPATAKPAAEGPPEPVEPPAPAPAAEPPPAQDPPRSLVQLPHTKLESDAVEFPTRRAAFSDDGIYVATTNGVAELHLWRVEDGHHVARLRKPVLVETDYSTTGYVEADVNLAFSPGSRWLLQTGRSEERLRVWDVARRKRVATARGSGEYVRWMLPLPTDEVLVGDLDAREAERLPLPRLRGSTRVRLIRSRAADVLDAVSRDGARLWGHDPSIHRDGGDVSLWTRAGDEISLAQRYETKTLVLAVRPTADERGAYFVTRGGTFGHFETFLSTPTVVELPWFKAARPDYAAISPDGTRVALWTPNLLVIDRPRGIVRRAVDRGGCSVKAVDADATRALLTCLLGPVDSMRRELRVVSLDAVLAD